MQKLTTYTIKWRRLSTLRREQFYDLLCRHADTYLLDEKFFEKILHRRELVGKTWIKLAAIQIAIFIVLSLLLVPIKTQFSILGVSSEINRNLREIFIFLSGPLAVMQAVCSANYSTLTDMIAAYAKKYAKGDSELSDFMGVAYGLSYLSLPKPVWGDLSVGPSYFILAGGLIVLSGLLYFCLFAVGIYIQYSIFVDIYLHPSFSKSIAVGVIAFALTCDVLTFALAALNGSFWRMRNFANLKILSKLSTAAPERAQEIFYSVFLAHMRKPWFLRLFTKPTIPKKLPLV